MAPAPRRRGRVAFAGASLALAALTLVLACTNREVVGVVVGSVTVSPATPTIIQGDSVQFTATVIDDRGDPIPNAGPMEWTVDPAGIITVSDSGMVHAIQPGSANVRATFHGVTGQTLVTVVPRANVVLGDSLVAFFEGAGETSPAPRLVTVLNGGFGTLSGLVASDDATWIDVSLSQTTTGPGGTATLTITPNIAGLGAGLYTGTVTVSSPDDRDGPATVRVTLSLVGMTVEQSGGSTVVSESGTVDTLTVKLDQAPTSNVTIDVVSGDTGEATVSPASLTFTPGNWNVAQPVVVTGQQDVAVDGTQPTPITISVNDASSDDAYDPLDNDTITVSTTDDDVAGFTVTATGAGTTVTEAGSTDSVSVVLTAQPLSNVVISVTSGDTGEAVVAPATLTFDGTNWNVPRFVTVTGVNDNLIDGSQPTTLTFAVVDASSDDAFDAVADRTLSVTTTDNDGAGYAVVQSGGTTSVTEAPGTGNTDTFTAVLTAQPNSDVVLSVTSGDTGEATVAPSTLTFTQGNWNVAQPVTVTGVDDSLVDGPQVTTITVAVVDASSDDNFDPLPDQTVNVTTVDDDNLGVTVTPITGLFTSEASEQAQFVVSLVSEPTANVTIALSSNNVNEGTVSPTSLTFTPSSGGTPWNVPQTVTVTGVDDNVDDGDIAYVIVTGAAVSSDPAYNGMVVSDVSVTNRDNDAAALSINDVTVVEGDAGSVNAVFTVTKSLQSTQTVMVDYATADGTAVAPADYNATSGTLTFLPGGPLTQTITVVVNGDLIDEAGATETFTVNLSNVVNAALTDASGLGTIIDNEDTSLSINDVTVTEGNAGTQNASFTVTLSRASAQTITVQYSTSNGTATAPADYTAIGLTTLTFVPGGSLTQTVNVVVNGDLVDEVNETFNVNLSNPTNATIADGTGLGTITDNDAATLAINDVTVTEGNAGTVNAVFTVTKSLQSSQTVTVDFTTAVGTATAPSDYATNSGTLTFLAGGALTQTVTVVVNGDLIDEGASETFSVNLSNAVNATIADATGLGTITDDDAATLSINDVTVTEGDGGPVTASFTVTMSAASSQSVTVDFATADGTATVAGNDYVANSGTLTFLPNTSLTRTVMVVVNGDLIDEINETFSVNLSAPVNATVTDATGVGTITDNDAATLSINDVAVVEGDAGTVNAVFTVTKSLQSSQTVTVDFATVNGSALAPADFTAISGTLTFLPGGPLTQTVTVVVNGDMTDEPGTSETFTVNLSNPANATITDAVGVGTIIDDEDTSLSINDVTVTEGNSGTLNASFTVTLSRASAQTVTVQYATSNGTATAPADYTAIGATTLTFLSGGALTQTVNVVVNGDLIDEVNETFNVTLSAPVNATIADGTGIGTITDNDTATLSINDVTVTEGNAGTVNVVFTVTKSLQSSQTVTVDFTTAAGTATAPSDYATVSGTLTFLAGGALTQTVTVVVNGDLIDEDASETFFVNLSNAVNATIADASGLGTIIDDEATTLSINDVTVTEGDGGPVTATFTVTMSAASSQTVTVDFATADGTATIAGNDYVANSGQLTFLPSTALTRTVTVVVNGDLIDELDETFSVNLTAPVNATIADATGLGTITDNDTATFSINDVAVVEGDAGTVNAVFTVTKSLESSQTATVQYATANGTAVAPADYAAIALTTLTFNPGGPLTQTVTVVVNGDVIDEAGTSETFTVNLSNAVNATIADGVGTGTIIDDEDTTLSIDDVTLTEGNSGTVNANFTVTLSRPSSQTVTVQYTTVASTAAAGTDYTTTSGTLTFTPGATTRPIAVPVVGDVIDELNETFSVSLSVPVNATIADATGLGTITDDDTATLSINDVTVTEGNAGTVNAVFTVTKSLASSQAVTVDFATANVSAVAPADYTANSGQLTFPAGGALTQTVTVVVNGDVVDEGASETFAVNLSNAVNATLADAIGMGTITDDESATLSIDDQTVTEGDGGPVTVNFTVTLSAASSQTVTVDFTTVDGTAAATTDYVANSGQLTFLPASALTRTVTVVVNGDLLDELDESFSVTLSNPANATIADATGVGTITDNDTATLSIDDVAVVEGDAGTVNAVFTVTKSLQSSQVVTVQYATANGTATAGSDYVALPLTTLTFNPGGPLTQTVTVVVNGDVIDEAGTSETFTVNLSNASNATIADASGTGTIIDDENTSLSIDDVTVNEGNAGTINASFTVTLSRPSAQTVTVDYATANGTATAGTDFTAIGTTPLTFSPGGSLTQTVTVAVSGDVIDELNETFTVNLSNAVNATLADASGLGTITDDDTAALFIDNVTVAEGNTGTVNAVFTVTKSLASSQNVTVNFTTSDGTATAPSDYTANSGTLTFLAGGALTQTVTVVVNGDFADEGASETFTVDLSNAVNATISDPSGLGTITDNDPPPTLTIGDVTVTEGNTGAVSANFPVNLSVASGLTVTVAYSTSAGTASAGTDFTTTSGTLTFTAGDDTETITVPVLGDLIDELDETFNVNLSSPDNATIADGSGLGTITDNDTATLSINDVTVTEGDAGTVNATFTVTKVLENSQTVTVDFATGGGNATGGGTDYTTNTGTLTFLPGGALTQTITVLVQGDVLDEVNETFNVTLSNATNATITDATGVGTITDDDPTPTLAINDVTVTETNAAGVSANFTVTLSAASGQTVTVQYATSNGSATAPADYTAIGLTTLTFNPGVTTQPVSVAIAGDALDEVDETFNVTLSNPANATLADATGLGTINDDDPTPSLSIDDVTVTETNAAGVNASFTVTLSAASGQTVTVQYSTANNTATAGADYTAIGLTTLTFNPGVTTQPVTVAIAGDLLDEVNETFFVNLTNPSNATLADNQGVGTINDEDPTPSLSINNATVTEGNAGTVNANFTVTLSAASGQTVTVQYATADNTAAAGADYTAIALTTLTFNPGVLTQPVTVVVSGDLIDELNETFDVNLSNQSNATIADGTGLGTITDDDTSTLAINDVSVTEGDAGTVNAVFTVTKTLASSQNVTVDFATSNGSATAGPDYITNTGTLTFLAGGALTQTVTVAVQGDALDELNETFNVTLSNAVNATITDATGVGTITDDDPTPTLSIDDVTVTETDAAGVNAGFTVTLSAPSGQTVTVQYATANNTATAGADYTAIGLTTLTFNPGVTTQPVNVAIAGDLLDEANETFFVNLSNASNATIADSQGLGTINDNDPTPTLSINDVAVTETNAAGVNASFTVTLSAVSGQTVTVQYATADNTAAAGADYTGIGLTTLTFSPGVTTQPVNVAVAGDLLDEIDETFFVNLSNASNATISDAQGIGTINDNDPTPTLSINDVTVTETDAVGVNANFTVTLSAASGQTVTVQYATADNTATAGADYTAIGLTTLTFNPGVTTQPVSVAIAGDLLDEANEAFFVNLSNPSNATIADNQGAGTITDNDPTPTLAIDDVTVTETDAAGVNANFTVTLSAASGQTVTVQYATSNGSATAPADYTSTSGTLTFTPGDTSEQIVVPIAGDLLDEAAETFNVNLSSPVNAGFGDNQGLGTITDDDPTPTLAIDDVGVTETNAAGVNATFTVTLSAPSGQTVTVQYATANGSATAPADYTSTSGTLTFTPGDTSEQIVVPIAGDLLDEAAETFNVNLSSPVNAGFGDNQGVGTITDNDPEPTLSIDDVTVNETNAAGVNATFTVTLSAASGQTVTVLYATSNGTATTPSDYTNTSGTLTFLALDVSETISVPIAGDLLDEANENFTVTLSGPTNATLADATGTGTITDNDPSPTVSISDGSITEGNSGTSTMNFTVSLSSNSGQTVTVQYSTSDVTAVAGADYTAASGTVTFAPGSTNEIVGITITGDQIDELNETFDVTLSSPVNTSITDGTGVGTITDNDTATLSIDDVAVTEGNAGTVNAVFTVTKSLQSSQNVTVDYATANGTATAGADYTAIGTTTLTFIAGGGLTQTVTVVVSGDLIDEVNETFFVNLSNGSTTISDNQGLGTITDDDAATLSIDDVSVTEGNSGTVNAVFTVTKTLQSSQNVTVDYATANGSATAGVDYTAIGTTTLTFTAGGGLTQTVSVVVSGDEVDEANETLFVNLTNGSIGITDTQGVGTINDDDTAGFTITESGGSTQVNELIGTDSFEIQLTSQPVSEVVLTIVSADTNRVTVGSATLTFTSGDWNVARVVDVLAGPEDVGSNVVTVLTIAVDDAQSDNAFDTVADQTVNVTTIDQN